MLKTLNSVSYTHLDVYKRQVVNREEAKSIGDENPLSFLHIDRPEMDLEPETDLYDDRRCV